MDYLVLLKMGFPVLYRDASGAALRREPRWETRMGTDRRADPGSARRGCQAVARFGSFHPGRGKWQVYPLGYVCR